MAKVFHSRGRKSSTTLKYIAALLLPGVTIGIATAADVALAWDANTEPDVAGYRIYYGALPGERDQMVDAGNVTTIIVAGLVEGQTYSFHATCYNTAGLESAPSNAIEYSVPGSGPGNEPPIAQSMEVITAEDTPVNIVLSGSDPDGDTLAYIITSEPAHGTLTGVAPDLTYTPSADFVGSDQFTFAVSDGHVQSEPAVVSITVNDVANTALRIIETVATDYGVILSWASVEGANYRVLYKTTLSDANWLTLGETVGAIGSTTSYADQIGEQDVAVRYYVVERLD